MSLSQPWADPKFMRRALALARRALPSPNPRVGAVIVSGGRIMAEGWHEEVGAAHAEVNALRQAGGLAKGSDLYVTLEPCCHWGRTGPCVDAILDAGVKRVAAGCIDPNPSVAGKGLRTLRERGVEVSTPVLQEECERLIAGHAKFVARGLPYVIWKYAMTLDGKIATAAGKSRWITGEKARREVHKMRAETDAVLIGSGTAVSDDPRLTARFRGAHQPYRVVFDSRATLPATAAVLAPGGSGAIVVTCEIAPPERLRSLRESGAEVLVLAGNRIDPAVALRELAERFGIREALLESGPRLAASMVKADLVDEVVCFIAGIVFGGAAPGPLADIGIADPEECTRARVDRVRRFGSDVALYVRLSGPCG